jgi:FKBP-type peptidyl-prolyl cis-trans isomerase SlyD
MKIGPETTIIMDYRVRDDQGTLLEGSDVNAPLTFPFGAGRLLPAMEAALVGAEASEQRSFILAAEDAYGLRDPSLDVNFPISAFPAEMHEHLVAGLRFRGPHISDADRTILYTVFGLEGDRVIASGNHRWAGKALHIEVTVREVRATVPEDLAGSACSGSCSSCAGDCGGGEEGGCGCDEGGGCGGEGKSCDCDKG